MNITGVDRISRTNRMNSVFPMTGLRIVAIDNLSFA